MDYVNYFQQYFATFCHVCHGPGILATTPMNSVASNNCTFPTTTFSCNFLRSSITGKPEQQQFTMRSGLLTSISIRQRSAISRRP